MEAKSFFLEIFSNFIVIFLRSKYKFVPEFSFFISLKKSFVILY